MGKLARLAELESRIVVLENRLGEALHLIRVIEEIAQLDSPLVYYRHGVSCSFDLATALRVAKERCSIS